MISLLKALKKKGYDVIEEWQVDGNKINPDYKFIWKRIVDKKNGYIIGYCCQSQRFILHSKNDRFILSSYDADEIKNAIFNNVVPKGYDKQLNKDLWQSAIGLNLDTSDISKMLKIAISCVERLLDKYLSQEDFNMTHAVREKVEAFVQNASCGRRLVEKTKKEREQETKEQLNYVLKHKDFELLGVKVRDMIYYPNTRLIHIKDGACDCNLYRLYYAMIDKEYKPRLERMLTFMDEKHKRKARR